VIAAIVVAATAAVERVLDYRQTRAVVLAVHHEAAPLIID